MRSASSRACVIAGRGIRLGRCGSREGRSGGCRARRLRRAVSGPPRRCENRPWSPGSPSAAPSIVRRAAPGTAGGRSKPPSRGRYGRAAGAVGRAQSVRRLDHHDGGGGNVDADLDHGGRHQQPDLAVANCAITRSFSAPFICPWTRPTWSPKRSRRLSNRWVASVRCQFPRPRIPRPAGKSSTRACRRQRAADGIDHFAEPAVRHRPGIDRLAPAGFSRSSETSMSPK